MMTIYYKDFIKHINLYIENKIKAEELFEYVDQLFFDHELDFARIDEELNDEENIVNDVRMLLDKYDSCEEIVKHDSYCIGDKELRKRINEMLPRINNPVY